ncbi:MAG: efflux RND transporter periplasmic adaptor subunit [Bacteroidetes bacterium]|nr:efflux RND transporter periplasmic adaptor subunit [Bacteroidota bacterium]
MKNIFWSFSACLFLMACGDKEKKYDATGTFEARETIISAQAAGIIQQFQLKEGAVLNAGDYLGFIDTAQLYLRKKQILAQIASLHSKSPNISLQIAVLESQLKQAKHENQRIEKLFAGGAATQKQLDDSRSLVATLQAQIDAQNSSLGTVSRGLGQDAVSLRVQLEQTNDIIEDSKIVNPIKGTVILKYAEPFEMATPGKPMYKIADLDTMILRAYITADQYANVKTGKTVKVYTDSDKGETKEYSGVITWINNKAEFTPKTIQTKNERANLVYAIKIAVKNDGILKIGMYGEVKF